MTFHPGAWGVLTIDNCYPRWNVTESHRWIYVSLYVEDKVQKIPSDIGIITGFIAATWVLLTTKASLRPPGKHGWISSGSNKCMLSSHRTARFSLYDELKAGVQSWLHHVRKEMTEIYLKFRPPNVKYWCQNIFHRQKREACYTAAGLFGSLWFDSDTVR